MKAAHVVLLALAVGLSITACSGGSPAPKVATLGTTTTVAAASGAPNRTEGLAQLAQYSACMRSHGVVGFPDPTVHPGGGISLSIQAGAGNKGTPLDPQSTTFKNADTACKHLLPNGGVQQPMSPAEQQKWLTWAACMRSHGLPNFPDPDFSGGGVRIGGPGAAIGPNDPGVQTAQKACQSIFPGGSGPQTASGGPG
jgi:hypothetical protein